MNSRKSSQSSGIYNLDYFLGGGYPNPGITLIEEDEFACLSNLLLNCTISNQLHDSKKVILSVPSKVDVDSYLKELPQRIKVNKEDQTDSESMKIAWRYSNLPDLDELQNQNKNDFRFELRSKLNDQLIAEKNMTENLAICTHDKLFEQLNETNKQTIIIKNCATVNDKFVERDFCTFLFRLKSLSRTSNSSIVLSINSNYISPMIRLLAINIVDCSFKIERLTEKSVYKEDYLGLIRIDKLPKINCLNYQTTTETLEIGIQFKKNRYLTVDRLFLPPELSDAPSRTGPSVVLPACSTKLDF